MSAESEYSSLNEDAAKYRTSRLIAGLWFAVGSLAIALGIVIAWPEPRIAPQARIRRSMSADAACTPRSPCLALVVDDIGRDVGALRQLLALPLDLTYSVLPGQRNTRLSAEMIARAGRERMLHLPLEPHDLSLISDEPVVLMRGSEDFARPLAKFFSLGPTVRLVNNHMGSAFSESPADVNRLMLALKPYMIHFLDSRTTPKSVLCAGARRQKIPCLQRDVFLDDPGDPATVAIRLQAAVRLARRLGRAVAVGHPERATVKALFGLRNADAKLVVRLSRLFHVSEVRSR